MYMPSDIPDLLGLSRQTKVKQKGVQCRRLLSFTSWLVVARWRLERL
jgi:hypothetical protein